MTSREKEIFPTILKFFGSYATKSGFRRPASKDTTPPLINLVSTPSKTNKVLRVWRLDCSWFADHLPNEAFSPKRDYDRLSTPSYSEVSGTDSKKVKIEWPTAVAGDLAGGSHDALMINAKMEQSEQISLTAGSTLLSASAPPPSTFTPLTFALPLSDALRPGPPGSQPDDLFDALDLDIAPAGTPIEHFIPNSILPHPDVRNKFSECYRMLAEKHMAHLNGTPRHMIVWSFAFQAKYAPAHVLFKYILEMKPLSSPPEARSNSRLPNHNICFAKTSHESKERRRLVWDYVSTLVCRTTNTAPLPSRIP